MAGELRLHQQQSTDSIFCRYLSLDPEEIPSVSGKLTPSLIYFRVPSFHCWRRGWGRGFMGDGELVSRLNMESGISLYL